MFNCFLIDWLKLLIVVNYGNDQILMIWKGLQANNISWAHGKKDGSGMGL
jgi:hypothetical protein